MNDGYNKFTLKIYNLVKPLYNKEKKDLAKRENKKLNEVWDEKEIYIKTVYDLFHKVDDSIKDLKKMEYYLLIDPFPDYFNEKEIYEKDYYKFQFENFYIRCLSTFDLSMHLINQTLKIGLPNNKCNYFNLIDNLNVKGTNLAKKAKKYFEDSKEIRSIRNDIIHQGKFESELLNDISAFIIPKIPIENDDDFINYSNSEKQIALKSAITFINKEITKFEFHFGEILEELNPFIDLQLLHYNLKHDKR
jgi:hypothetical protein